MSLGERESFVFVFRQNHLSTWFIVLFVTYRKETCKTRTASLKPEGLSIRQDMPSTHAGTRTGTRTRVWDEHTEKETEREIASIHIHTHTQTERERERESTHTRTHARINIKHVYTHARTHTHTHTDNYARIYILLTNTCMHGRIKYVRVD